MNHSDVIVIGAGVIGCAIARELSRARLSIRVLERNGDIAEGSTKANSAIVHAGYDATPGTLKARFNVRGNALFEPYCRELGVSFRRNGSLVVAFSEAEVSHLEALRERGEANGVPDLHLIGHDELARLEPHLHRDAVAALVAPTGGICCPYDLTFRLAENAAVNGVSFQFDTTVTTLRREHDGLWHVATDNGTELTARAVVNAAGLYADEMHNQASAERLTITPRRGEYLLMDKAYGDAFHSTVFQVPSPTSKGTLITPAVDGVLLIGPTADNIESKTDTRTTPEGLAKLQQAAERLWNGFPRGAVITTFAGLRARGDRNDFVVGEAPDAPFFFDAAAMESPGLTAAPAVGEWLAEQLCHRLGAESNNEFVPHVEHWRVFRTMTDKERAAAIADDPSYGRIVCRCETVSEAEIRAAIRCRVGARSLDGVKRRTRAGFGRCQGGFCAPRIVAILCEELGLNPEQVTKCGGASHLLAGEAFHGDTHTPADTGRNSAAGGAS